VSNLGAAKAVASCTSTGSEVVHADRDGWIYVLDRAKKLSAVRPVGA